MKTKKSFYATALAILLIASVDCFAQKYQEYAAIRDLSTSQQIDRNYFKSDLIYKKTVGELSLVKGGQGYRFFVSCIGKGSYPIVKEVALESANYWTTSLKSRQEAIDKSKSEIMKHLDSISALKHTHQYSSLYRGIIHTILRMDPKSKKTVFVFSDGIESYLKTFKDIKDWTQEYEAIKSVLVADQNIPDVENLEIVFICSGKYETAVQSLRFFVQLFEDFGIQASIRSNV